MPFLDILIRRRGDEDDEDETSAMNPKIVILDLFEYGETACGGCNINITMLVTTFCITQPKMARALQAEELQIGYGLEKL